MPNFYENLPIFEDFGQVIEFNRYRPVPGNWNVIVADIVDSTQAIEDGKYKQVNVLGAAIITAVTKLFYPRSIPYIFGGDGVFLCAPPDNTDSIRNILEHVRLLADRQFGLQQVSGIVPVQDIREAGADVRVARFYVSENYQQAVFQGDGLEKAETLLRDPVHGSNYQVEPALHNNTDLSNLECRWNHMESIYDEIICLLVKVVATNNREQIYRRVINAINRIYCEELVCKPVQESKVNLTFNWDKLSVEYRIRTFGKSRLGKIIYILQLFAMQLAGKIVMYFGLTADGADWSRYKWDLEKNTDYRKFDDMIRQVLSGTREKREELDQYLEKLYQEGYIVYGIHAAPTVMLTCMVMNYDQEHFHFVDGSAGGYAAAAADMKKRMVP